MRTLLQNGCIVTVNGRKDIFSPGALIIQDDKIEWVGPRAEQTEPEQRFDEIIDAGSRVIVPGFINAHTHNVYYLMRGVGMDRDLKDWLRDAIWPGLKTINREEAYIGSLLGCLENLKSGTTCIIDNYYSAADKKENIDGVFEGIEAAGIKAVVARGYSDVPFNIPVEFLETEDELAAEYSRILTTWHGKNSGKIGAWISPVNLLYSSPSSIKRLGRLADEYGAGLHTHVAEARFEVEEIRKRYGKSYIDVFHDLGVINERFHAAHSVHLQERDIQRLADAGAAAMFNPTCNMLLASGIAPVETMLRVNLTVALGTDAPNDNQDMLESMKMAALLSRVKNNDPTAVSSCQALEMATIQGARALGLDQRIGSLEPGKQADLVLIMLDRLHNVPSSDPVATLVYASNQSDVETVYLDGKKVVDKGLLVYHDEQKIVEEERETADNLYRRSGIG